MNIQNTISRTAAEEALFDQFNKAVGSLPGLPSIVEERDKSFAALTQNGLPTRRVESWHYTDLRRMLTKIPSTDMFASTQAEKALVDGAIVLSVLNGAVANIPSNLPVGMSINKLSDELVQSAAPHSPKALEADDTIGQINGAFVSDGFVIDIAAEANVEKLVELQFAQGGGQAHSRMPVHFGENSKATIIERHLSTDDNAALVSSVAQLTLAKGAHARWIIVQDQGSDDTHLGQVNIDLAEDCKLELYVVNVGGKLVRQEIIANVNGSNSNLTLRGVNLLSGDTHTDVTLKLGHNVPDTTSDELFRNVVFDKAKGVFQGQIKVAQIAQKTDAQMACNTLLLSDNADFSAKPELEIFADDVICAHGATVTDIDPAHLFYMMARGVSERSARGLLVKGFVAEVVEEFDNEAVVEALENVISNWLDKNG